MLYQEILGPRCFPLRKTVKEENRCVADVYNCKNPVRLIPSMYRDNPIVPLPELGLLCIAPDIIVLAFCTDDGNDVCRE
jgi:hypothetical protein